MNIPRKVEKQAIYWYVRIQSPAFTPDQKADFFSWLEASSLHQVAFLQIEQAWQTGKMLGRMAQAPIKASRDFFKYGAGAFAVVLLGIFIYLGSQGEKRLYSEHFATTTQQSHAIKLPDGTLIDMHINTDVTIHYYKNTRQIDLAKGRIFLQVAHDAKRPLFVITQAGSLQVLGTKFAVEELDKDFKITVVEGRVGILEAGVSVKQASAPKIILTHNEQILFSTAAKGQAASQVDAGNEVNWVKGRLMFDGASLNEVVATINPHLSAPIKIDSNELGQKRIVGAISIQNPTIAATSLAALTGAIIETNPNGPGLVLKSKSR